MAWCPRQPQRPPCFSPFLHPPAPPEVSRHSLLLPGVSNNTNRDAQNQRQCVRVHRPQECKYAGSALFSSYACILYRYLSFIEYLNKQNILEVSRRRTFYSPSSSSEGCDHIAPLSQNQISLSRHLKRTGFVPVKVMQVHVVFLKCQNSVCFSVLLCFLVGLQYSYQGKGSGGLHSKISLCLSVCLSFCPSVHLCDCPACLSDCLLCHFTPLSVILP